MLCAATGWSCAGPPRTLAHGARFARYQAELDQVPNLFGSFAQRGFGFNGPAHGYAHEDSLGHAGEVAWRNVAPDFAAFLGEQENPRQDAAGHVDTFHEFVANGCARGVCCKDRAQQGRTFVGLAHGISHQFPDYIEHGSFRCASFLKGAFHGSGALAAEFGQDVLLRGEIIEKGAFAHVGRFGDVLHGGFQETAFSEERQGGAVEAVAGFGPMAFAAAGARDGWCWEGGRGSRGGLHEDTIPDYRTKPTISQHWTAVNGSLLRICVTGRAGRAERRSGQR